MNKWNGIGRLTRDPDVRYSQGDNATAVARYTLAVDRKFKREGEQDADFINCVAFGKNGEFAEKYLHKGMKIAVTGRIQTGSYTDRETGKTVYTTDVVIEEQEFCERKQDNEATAPAPAPSNNDGSDFMSIPEGVIEELPFN